MTKKPVINAFAAAAYIVLIVFFIGTIMDKLPDVDPEPILIPMVMISLFTLSAAVMGYLFVLEPLKMYLDGKKKEGVKLFVQTLAVFASITVLLILTLIIYAYTKGVSTPIPY